MNKIELLKDTDYLYQETLANGLTVYMIPNKNVNSYYINYCVKYGSSIDTFKLDTDEDYTVLPKGIAHYIEHLTFKIDGKSAFDFFDKIGCYANAFTSYSSTDYIVSGSSSFKSALGYLMKYVNTPDYSDESIKKEFGIISEEINRNKDMISRIFYQELMENVFVNNNCRYSVAGDISDIKEITLDLVNKTYETFYQPSNMFIIITGNFDVNEALDTIKNNNTKQNVGKIIIKENNEPDDVRIPYALKKHKISLSKVGISYKFNRKQFKDIEATIKIFYFILSNNFNGDSKNVIDLLKRNIISSSISSSINLYNESLLLNFYCDTIDANKFISEFDIIINNLVMDEEILNRKKKSKYSKIIRSYDDIETINNVFHDDIIFYNKVIDDISIINNIKLDDIKESIELIKHASRTVLVYEPEDK